MKRVALIALILALGAVAVFSTVERFRLKDELAAANARANLARAQAKDLGGILRKTQSGAVLKRSGPRNGSSGVWIGDSLVHVEGLLSGPSRGLPRSGSESRSSVTAS